MYLVPHHLYIVCLVVENCAVTLLSDETILCLVDDKTDKKTTTTLTKGGIQGLSVNQNIIKTLDGFFGT